MSKVILCFLAFGLSAFATAEQAQDLQSTLQNAKMEDTGANPQAQKVQKLGFKEGDTIREINGQAVTNPQRAMQLYNQMKPGDTATVIRNGNADDTHCVPNIQPHSAGQVNGFKCFNIHMGSPLQTAGILNGDIILSIDGKTMDSPQQMHEFLSLVSSKNYSQIRVVRNGREEVLPATQ